MNLADPKTLRELLARHGIAAAKGLGQHFLCSSKVVEAIERRFDGFSSLLEIGPGPGALTSVLSIGRRMVALEVDSRMVGVLAESAPSADVRLADALETDLAPILEALPKPRGVVSNLPYYITGPLLTRIAEASAHWDKAVLMMQKEVANRILAQPGNSDRGSLSVYLQSQFVISLVANVPPGAFVPPPKVDSAVLEFVPLGGSFEPAFFEFVRSGFKQPRKTLVNNLRSFGLLPEVLSDVGLDERVRPHELTLDQWLGVFGKVRG